ncbi:thiamine pyrophosphate-dependent enzyme, partial [Bacillus thuringiensis]|uniref:thiamine pyrophosphate-dependent enzyme n=1 Tax=Bacillus thuringiensis TaxID=1428 RepID=UPI00201BEF06
ILLFEKYLMDAGVMTETIRTEMEQRVMAEVNEVTDYAEAAPYAQPEQALKYVYAPVDGGDM